MSVRQHNTMNTTRTTPDHISTLEDNEIFVFGSNIDGIHGAGAAQDARRKFGAEYGIAEGITGKCYAIPTVDFKLKRYNKRYPIKKLEDSIVRFLNFAVKNQNMVFLLTPIGCGLAGFTADEVAGLFLNHKENIPDNIVFPKVFLDIILSDKNNNSHEI